MVLRDYQEDCCDRIRGEFRKGLNRVLLVSPTGSGKTVLFSHVTQGAVSRGLKVLLIAHRQEILGQISRCLTQFSVSHGLIAAGHPFRRDHQVQVASVQTLVRRLDAVPAYDFIVVDEAHHSAASTWCRVFAHFDRARYLGVTATPERLDGRGLGDYYQSLVTGPSVQWLIDNKFLARPVYFVPPPHQTIDLSKVRTLAGDFNKGDLAAAVDLPSITGDAVAHYRERCCGQKAIVFCVSLVHAGHVCDQFRTAGFGAAMIDGTLTEEERRTRIEDLESGRVPILVSVDVIGEGLDVGEVSAIISLRPTASLAMAMQHFGRGLRPKANGGVCTVLDHAGNVLRHGMAEEPREWTLEGGTKKKPRTPEVQARQCAKCYAIFSGRSCPECGSQADTQGREIRQRDGRLVMMTAAEIMAARSKVATNIEEGQCRSLGDWRKLAASRNYSPGWAWHRWTNSRWHKKVNSEEARPTLKQSELLR